MNFFKYLAILLRSQKSLSVATWEYLHSSLPDPNDFQLGHSLLGSLPLSLDLSSSAKDKAKEELEYCLSAGIEVTYPGAEDFPQALLEMETPPSVLTYKGEPAWQKGPALAVVGTRGPSHDTRQWLEGCLTEALMSQSCVLVSGGARGVDQQAHAMAIRCARPTVCFLPSGLGRIYPANLESWESAILASGGCFVSQFSPQQRMYKSHFIQRNRLIAALSQLVFVAEAARKSGSLLTAKMAMDLGKPLATLPVSPMSSRGLGSLDLLFDGAHMVRDSWDLLALMARYFPVASLGSRPSESEGTGDKEDQID